MFLKSSIKPRTTANNNTGERSIPKMGGIRFLNNLKLGFVNFISICNGFENQFKLGNHPSVIRKINSKNRMFKMLKQVKINKFAK